MKNIISYLDNLLNNKTSRINDWFVSHHQNNQPFFYNSVDIRYSGYKIAPVDTNIFPAGFNNLSNEAKLKASSEIENFLKKKFPEVKKILIIAEFHTRNLHYLENLKTLSDLFTNEDTKCGYLPNEENKILELQTASSKNITLYPIERKDNTIYIDKDFSPDLIIVNNDLTAGSPEILHNICQPVIPSTGMGWYRRKKHSHFLAYNHIARIFAKEFDFDPFLISTELGFCKDVNFREKKGIECIAINVEKTLKKIRHQYEALNIKSSPYVYLKANRGTYGMGIMAVNSAEEILNLNKKYRNKMNIIKNNTLNAEILIQEGIETIDTYHNSPAEPFIYFINGKPIGNILRTNKNRDHLSNLNSSGAEFISIDNNKSYLERIPTYQLISKLAVLAATIEEKFDE